MNFVDSGSGFPIVLIHGLFGDCDNLKGLGRELEQLSFRVIRVDCPNHGKSAAIHPMTYPAMAAEIKATLDSIGIQQFMVVGHSMGGKIAMTLALSYPESVTAVVATDIAPVVYQPHHQKVFAGLNSMPADIKDRRAALAHLISHDIDEGTAQFLLKSLVRGDNQVSWKFNLAELIASYHYIVGWYNIEPNSIASYQGPILFLRGGDSNYVKAEYQAQIVAQFPHASAKTIEGTGHWLHAQKPAVFNRVVCDFIAKCAANS
ncbi:alpha/beta fold hydrolase [Shewanella avicenniae]|uniref:Alpha/beta fold hydrolase n=1 Tax=Shewanella avicenniae TaxID=2814294 RepID=A0ABX7QW08_9GAMM|nr:alpha/beta fold hydrolase [Shewanella avicenniae]QSX35449.1 alpha/beta fold hydrolase [Shewanella avicenniae]